jgi:molecular chaperone HscB
MICWSCEKDAGPGVFCQACAAIQPAPTGLDHFAVLGVAPGHDLDESALEKAYRDLSRQVHPDRYARADARARRASLARSVQLNQAWKTLRDPVKRAEYLLSLQGYEVGGEEGTHKPGAGGSKERVPVPQDLLMEVMELREALLEARGDGDQARIQGLTADVRGRRERALSAVATALRAQPADLDAAAGELVVVRYMDRFLAEVDAHEDRQGEVSGAG